MTKEQLIALGLTEEQADKVIVELDKGHMIPKNRLDDKIQEVKDLQDQLTERDKDLKDLKKQAEGSEELQKQLTDLQGKYDTEKADYESKLKDTQLSSAIKLALAGKVHDSDIAISQIDKATIELGEDGNIVKGLDEQIKTLQESKPFLFVPEKPETPEFKGTTPVDNNNPPNGNNDPFAAKLAQYK